MSKIPILPSINQYGTDLLDLGVALYNTTQTQDPEDEIRGLPIRYYNITHSVLFPVDPRDIPSNQEGLPGYGEGDHEAASNISRQVFDRYQAQDVLSPPSSPRIQERVRQFLRSVNNTAPEEEEDEWEVESNDFNNRDDLSDTVYESPVPGKKKDEEIKVFNQPYSRIRSPPASQSPVDSSSQQPVHFQPPSPLPRPGSQSPLTLALSQSPSPAREEERNTVQNNEQAEALIRWESDMFAFQRQKCIDLIKNTYSAVQS